MLGERERWNLRKGVEGSVRRFGEREGEEPRSVRMRRKMLESQCGDERRDTQVK